MKGKKNAKWYLRDSFWKRVGLNLISSTKILGNAISDDKNLYTHPSKNEKDNKVYSVLIKKKSKFCGMLGAYHVTPKRYDSTRFNN
jgi:hypothetical protein